MNAELFELYKNMIRCRAVSSDIDAVNKSEKLLSAFLQKQGFHCTEEMINGRVVVYASTRPGKVQDLLLNAHVDVVPAAYEEQFEPRMEGDILYARGAHDCLGNLMAIVQCMLNAGDKYSIGAIFTADEEIGGLTTAGMVERGYGARKAALVVDAGGYGKICYAQKGIIILTLKATGVGGHASAPWNLDNPIDKLIDGYNRFRSAWTNPDANNTWLDSMTPCILRAGEADNAIPDTAEMTLNIRFTTDEARDRIINMAKELTGLDVRIGKNCLPVVMDPETPEIQLLGKAFETADPEHPLSFYRMMGATDARHLKELGIPIGIIGVAGGGAHGKKEYLELPSIDICANVMLEYARLLSAEEK